MEATDCLLGVQRTCRQSWRFLYIDPFDAHANIPCQAPDCNPARREFLSAVPLCGVTLPFLDRSLWTERTRTFNMEDIPIVHGTDCY